MTRLKTLAKIFKTHNHSSKQEGRHENHIDKSQ